MAKKKEVLFEFPHPIDNDCLVGNGTTLKTFMDAWNNRESHPIHPVWMLCGPRGIGKSTLAYKIAKKLGFRDLTILETLEREMEIRPQGTRPKTRMVGHSGYLVFARKL